jgi:ABC-2 type transport system ATP-binding protein
VHAVRDDETSVRFEVDNDLLGPTMEFVASFGVVSLVSSPPTLEELFMREYGDEAHADAVGEGGER